MVPAACATPQSMPSWCHNPSSNHTPPSDRDEVTRSRSTSPRPVPGVRIGVAQVAGDGRHQPAQPVGVQGVLPAQVDQHPGPGLPVDPLVVRQRHVAHHRPVGVLAAGHPKEHVHKSIREPRTPWAGHDQLVCPHIRPPQARIRPAEHETSPHRPSDCPPTAELGVEGRWVVLVSVGGPGVGAVVGPAAVRWLVVVQAVGGGWGGEGEGVSLSPCQAAAAVFRAAFSVGCW